MYALLYTVPYCLPVTCDWCEIRRFAIYCRYTHSSCRGVLVRQILFCLDPPLSKNVYRFHLLQFYFVDCMYVFVYRAIHRKKRQSCFVSYERSGDAPQATRREPPAHTAGALYDSRAAYNSVGLDVLACQSKKHIIVIRGVGGGGGKQGGTPDTSCCIYIKSAETQRYVGFTPAY